MERDQSSGNDYDHARYHLTGIGRFLSMDKLGGKPADPQSWNRYSYSRGNPVTLVDPNGRYFLLANENDRAQFANAFVTASGDSRVRAALTTLAHDPRPILLQKGALPSETNTVIGKDGKRHVQTSFTLGLTEAKTPLAPNGGDRTASGAIVTVDFSNIAVVSSATNGQIDPVGAVTTTHEIDHAFADFFEGVGASQQQDVTGAAEDFGEGAVFFPNDPAGSFSLQQVNELLDAVPSDKKDPACGQTQEGGPCQQ
jgi:RHS repeat-associated protein